jgi:pyruvate,water dikinase
MEARSSASVKDLRKDPRLSVTQQSYLPFIRRVWRIAFKYAIPFRILEAVARPQAARARVAGIGENLRDRITNSKPADADERLDFVEHVLANEIIAAAPKMLPIAAIGFAMLGLASKLLGDDVYSGDLQNVLRGLPNNITTEMDLALWKLANRIREYPVASSALRQESATELSRRFLEGRLPQPAPDAIEEFLKTYGHRAVAEIDIGMPRWSDEPAHILGVIANYLRLNNKEQAPDALFARGASEAEAMIDTLVSRARRRGWLRSKLVGFALRRARQLVGLRESPKYYMILALAAVRRHLAIIGTELAHRGRIEIADDVFFLDLAEVRAAVEGGDLRKRVSERRHTYELEMRRRHVPGVLLSDGTEPEAKLASAPDTAGLAGTPASAGTVTGVARVVLDPVGAHLEPGEILVAPSTDPGWTPLFLTAGGLVMEMGGANSHGAVVAREYGIPAVVGVADATLRITTGQRLTVDGANGTITLLESPTGE